MPVGEDGIVSKHEQPRHLRHVGDDVLGDAIAEELLLRVVAHVGEGQNRNRWLVRLGLRMRPASALGLDVRGSHRHVNEISMHRLGDVSTTHRWKRLIEAAYRRKVDPRDFERQLHDLHGVNNALANWTLPPPPGTPPIQDIPRLQAMTRKLNG